jgi:hypothetical protein
MSTTLARLLLPRARAGADQLAALGYRAQRRAAHTRVWHRIQMDSAPLQPSRLVPSSSVPRDHLPLTPLSPCRIQRCQPVTRVNEYNYFLPTSTSLMERESWVLASNSFEACTMSRMFRQGSLDRLGGCIPQLKRLFCALLKSSESCHAGAYPLSLVPPRAMGDETHTNEDFMSGSPRENPGLAS